MILAKTESGFEIELDEIIFNDAKFMDDAVAADEGDLRAFLRLASKLLDADGKKKLYDHLSKEDGRVPLDEYILAVKQIMNSCAAGKNSSSSPT